MEFFTHIYSYVLMYKLCKLHNVEQVKRNFAVFVFTKSLNSEGHLEASSNQYLILGGGGGAEEDRFIPKKVTELECFVCG